MRTKFFQRWTLAGLLLGFSLLLTASQALPIKKPTPSQRVGTSGSLAGSSYRTDQAHAKILANTVLLSESFDSYDLPSGWATNFDGEGVTGDFLSVDGGGAAGGDTYELYFYGQSATGTVRLIVPLNTTGFSKLFVSFKHYMESWYEGPKFKIQTSSDLITWTDEAWGYQASSSEWTKGPESVTTVLTHNLNIPATYMAFVVTGNLSDLYRWNIDDITVESEKSSFDMPYAESFSVPTLPQSWAVKTEGDGVLNFWGVSNSATAGGTVNEMFCQPQQSQGTIRLITPPIDTTTASAAFLSFKYRFYAYEPGLTVKVQSSPDGVTWTDEAWSLESSPYTALVDAQSVTLPITHNTDNPSTYIAFVIQGDLSKFVDWYIDDVGLSAPSAIYNVPFTESFETSGMPAYWTKQALGQGVADTWKISPTDGAGGEPYEALCDYRLYDGAMGTARLVSPPIDTRGHSVLTLTFNTSFVCYGTDITYGIQTSRDGVNWTNEWSFDSSEGGYGGPLTIDIANNLNIQTTFVAFTISGNFDLQGQWFIDDIVIAPSGAGPGVLTVSPVDGFSSSGFAGGPFSPLSKDYVLENTGETSIYWSVGGTQLWTTPVPATGSLGPGETAVVTVSLNRDVNLLTAGPYVGSATFTNTTNGNGNAVRPVNLTIIPLPNVAVAPAKRDVPYAAGSTTFGVTNTGGGTLNWNAAVMAGSSWMTLQSGASGTNGGTISIAYTANTWTLPRTGTMQVTASGATNSPTFVTVTQAAAQGFAVLLNETFDTYEFPPPGWTRHVEGEGVSQDYWSLSENTTYAGGLPHEAHCHYQSGTGAVRLVAQIDSTGYSTLYLTFKHYLDLYGPGATFKIQTSSDLVTWTDEGWAYQTPDGDFNLGPGTVNAVLTHNLNRATTYVAFVVSGNLFQFDDWYIDDVRIESAGSVNGIPFAESFAGPDFPLKWSVKSEGDGVENKWKISNSAEAGGEPYEISCVYQSATGLTRLISPPIDTSGYSFLYMTFKHKWDGYGVGGVTFKIQTSADGVNWADAAWSVETNSGLDVGPESVTTILSQNIGIHSTYVAFAISGELVQYDGWFIDDISIHAPGQSQAIPFSESFDGSALPAYWSKQHSGPGVLPLVLSVSETANAGGVAPNEIFFNYPMTSAENGALRLVTPAIDTKGISSLSLAFWHTLHHFGENVTYKIQTSSDGLSWTDEEWFFDSSSGTYAGPEHVETRITHNLGIDHTFVAFAITGDVYQNDYWYIDDVTVGPYTGPVGILEVTPETGLESSGLAGGPFDPALEQYHLYNGGEAALNWTATKTQNWVTLSSSGGTLDPGEGTTVTVSINSLANSLPVNHYSDTVTFTNTTPGGEVIGRPVSVTVSAPSVSLEVTSPDGGESWVAGSQRNITWTQTGLSGAVNISLYKGGAFKRNLGTASASAGTFPWQIRADETPGNDYGIRVWQGGYYSDSAANFSITSIVRVDFDKDGKEDILWRYYGAGGYNRVWYLGTVGQPSAESLGTEVQTGQDSFGSMAAEARSMRAAAKSLRDLGLVSRKRMKSRARIPAGLMIMDAKKMQDVGSVDDPRKVRGQYLSDVRLLEPTRTSDPRSVGSVSSGPRPEDQAAADATLSSLPQFLGGADIWPVDDMNWHICGAADFDKDGNIDILWRNVSTGVNIIWFMVGTQWSRSAELLLVQDQNWQIVGTGDFDNDGNVDILWRNSVYGWNTVWHMNGSSWLRSSPVMTVTDLTWQIVGTGDFNKDGNVDILWRNSVSGANVIWNMNGTSWSSSVPLITVDNLAWQIAGTGDYNNDGNIDILWRFYGAGGANVIWYMNGASWSVSGELLPVQNLSWKIVSR